MNGKGNARKLITPNKKIPKGAQTLWDKAACGRAEGKGDDHERYGAPSCGRYYRNDVAIRGCSSEDKARMAYAVEEAESGITSILHVEPTPTPSPTPEPLPRPSPYCTEA